MKIMKNLLLTMVLLLTTTVVYSQMYIERKVDEMDGNITYSLSETIYETEDDKEALVLMALGEKMFPHTLAVVSRGIESCIEKGEVIILFKDGSRLTARAWNDFNCDGRSWFNITKKMADELSTKEVDKMRITNGRSNDSFTFKVSSPRYFIEAYALCRAGVFK